MVLSPTVTHVHRSNLAYIELLARREVLDAGYALLSDSLAQLPLASLVAEFDDAAAAPGIKALQAHFRDRGSSLSAIIPLLDANHSALAPIMQQAGLIRRAWSCLALPPAAALPATPADTRILAARAMRRAYTQVCESRAVVESTAALGGVAAQLERLNFAHYDAFVAFRGDQPAGAVALFQVGEIGRICDLFVIPEQRRSGIGAALLSFAVGAARRWALRHIVTQIVAGNAAGARLLARIGFASEGIIVSYWRDGAPECGEW